jgi:FkbM family methyltransferase
MSYTAQRIGFVLASTNHGTLIVNRFDEHRISPNQAYGVGFQLLETSSYEHKWVDTARRLLDLRRHYYGDGVVVLDCGANIGSHAIEWARHMAGWGSVVAIEAQERIFYALAGNLVINNCFNARAVHAAIGNTEGIMKIPEPSYLVPGSFGSLELRKRDNTEFIGQKIDYTEAKMVEVRAITLDSLKLARIDLIKMDIEGMELEALEGAAQSLSGHHPMLIIETIKLDQAKLRSFLEQLEYRIFDGEMNILAVHRSDQSLAHVALGS